MISFEIVFLASLSSIFFIFWTFFYPYTVVYPDRNVRDEIFRLGGECFCLTTRGVFVYLIFGTIVFLLTSLLAYYLIENFLPGIDDPLLYAYIAALIFSTIFVFLFGQKYYYYRGVADLNIYYLTIFLIIFIFILGLSFASYFFINEYGYSVEPLVLLVIPAFLVVLDVTARKVANRLSGIRLSLFVKILFLSLVAILVPAPGLTLIWGTIVAHEIWQSNGHGFASFVTFEAIVVAAAVISFLIVQSIVYIIFHKKAIHVLDLSKDEIMEKLTRMQIAQNSMSDYSVGVLFLIRAYQVAHSGSMERLIGPNQEQKSKLEPQVIL